MKRYKVIEKIMIDWLTRDNQVGALVSTGEVWFEDGDLPPLPEKQR